MTRSLSLSLTILACWTVAVPAAQGDSAVTRQDGKWLLENTRLRVLVDPAAGTLSVLDKDAGYTWRQPGVSQAKQSLALRQSSTPPKIDGQPGDWQGAPTIRLTHDMLSDDRKVDSDADCSASAYVVWDLLDLYVGLKVADDRLAFADPGLQQWWEKDSLELWVGSTQVGLNLSPKGSQARSASGQFDGAQIALKPNSDGRGYVVEAALPWSLLGRAAPKPGDSFPFAIGINDADATGSREGQLYFPATWKHSQPDTFAQATLADADGKVPPTASAAASAPRFRNAKPVPAGIQFETDVPEMKQPVLVRLTVPDKSADLVVGVDLPDRSVSSPAFVAVEPFAVGSPNGALAVADYSNGHLYPLSLEPFPRAGFSGDRLDMPWVGLTDLDKGHGYALILDTPDDCGVNMEQRSVDGRTTRVPRVRWRGSYKSFRYARRMTYRFCPKGGYVALAKAYRAYAKSRGLLVTLAEKAKRNPNVRRLFGAPDLWGDSSLNFAREAKALGVDRMLIHGGASATDMKEQNDLGYLTSRYDNYTDILPLEAGKEIDSSHAPIPEHAVLKQDDQRMTAWLTFDKKTQYMKRCPALWLDAAKQVIPKELGKLPYLGRFIDVTTAEGLYECYDPAHPLTRTQKRECGQQLEAYVRDQKLVGGGEHGLWWGVPSMCYLEGMMSGGSYSWPAGHLLHPKTKDQDLGNPWGNKLPPFSEYEKWGIGHYYRMPLWELVFHDCIVTTWYWGDASDWLLDAAPEVTPKKDAFNVLYGTIPLLWANAEGSWRKNREVFLRTYRNTCKLHEQLAPEELLTHEFVTPDRAVQRTTFASGTEVVVNFGEKPQQVTVKGEKLLLPQNGFAVRGPKVKQSLALVDGKAVTTIQTPGYWYSSDKGVVMRREAPGVVRIGADLWPQGMVLDPSLVAGDWDPSTAIAYRLDREGERVAAVDWINKGKLQTGLLTESSGLELVFGRAAQRPDLGIREDGVERNPQPAKRGQPIRLSVQVRNAGSVAGRGRLTVHAAPGQAWSQLASANISVGARAEKRVDLTIPTDRLDGWRVLDVGISPDGPAGELCVANNRATVGITVNVDRDAWPWPARVEATVDPGDIARSEETVVLPVDLGPVLRRAGIQGSLDPGGIRLVEYDVSGGMHFVPSQFDPATDFDATTNPKGVLCWRMWSQTPANQARRFYILLPDQKTKLWPNYGSDWTESTQTVDTTGYKAGFADGVLTSISRKLYEMFFPRLLPDFLHSLIFSSADTGWGQEEASTVKRFEVLHTGPVRTVIRVEKELKAGVTYEKTYTFYPNRIDIEINVNKQAGGLYSRAHYKLPGTFIDNAGVTAKVDGNGEENQATYGKTKDPRWYAVLGDGWAHSCIALSKFDHIAYWDGGQMGAIGFVGGEYKNVRMSYVIHGLEKDASFAEDDWKRLTNPVKVRIEEPAQ